MSHTVSDEHEPRRRDRRAPRRPVLRILFHAWNPGAPTSRHALDGVEVIELGRGPAGVARPEPARLRVQVADPRMSGDHGRLVARGDHWLLEDPRSKNGAVVLGQPTRCAPVRTGDLFELGHTMFLLDDEDDDGAPADLTSDTLASPVPALASFVPAVRRAAEILARVAPSDVPVVFTGESGTGKEIWARALHARSGRAGPFVAVHCGGLAPQLVESELFGHRRGAFSGATHDRPGYLRAADRGTLFLDELGDLPAPAQVALLRALQEREVVPVGDERPVPIDVRIVAASHRDLAALVDAGDFRPDLHARLLGVTLVLPPLRERRGDLGLLIARLLERVPGGAAATFTPAAAYALCQHGWPLNVRELERVLAAAVARAAGEPIEVEHLPDALAVALGDETAPVPPPAGDPDDDPALRATVVDALARHAGNVAAVARELGKHREQIHRWLRRHGIDPATFRDP